MPKRFVADFGSRQSTSGGFSIPTCCRGAHKNKYLKLRKKKSFFMAPIVMLSLIKNSGLNRFLFAFIYSDTIIEFECFFCIFTMSFFRGGSSGEVANFCLSQFE